MTRTITLIIGIVVTALAVAAPTALGEGRLAGSQPDGVAAFIGNERATLLQQSVAQVGSYRDANQRVNVVVAESPQQRADRLRGEGMNTLARQGVFDNSAVAYESPEQRAEELRSEGLNRMYGLGDFATANSYKDANQRVDLPTTPVVEPVTGSGTDVEWPQIGIGFGIGILLAIALGLSLRVTRHRPLAH